MNYQTGDLVTIELTDFRPWYVVLWHWMIRRPPPQPQTFRVGSVTSTTFTLDDGSVVTHGRDG